MRRFLLDTGDRHRDRREESKRLLMREPRILGLGLALTLFCSVHPDMSRAQSPAPVENVSSFPPRTPAEERKALHRDEARALLSVH